MADYRQTDFWKKKNRRAIESRDINKNGFISRNDFLLVLERYKSLAKNAKPERIEALTSMIHAACDTAGMKDESVQLTYDEFEARWPPYISKENREYFQKMFYCLDINGDGVITLNEWTIHYNAMGIPSEHAKASFDSMDANKDGTITMDEFLDYHVEYFCTADNKLNSAILYGPL